MPLHNDTDRKEVTMKKRVAYCGMMVALAMIFSYVEVLIPINFGIPGIKLGIANLIVVIGLFLLKPGEVLLISMVRILLVGYLFGNGMSLLYSIAGGLLSFLVMYLIKKIKGFSIIGISIAGGVVHNIGQLVVAAWVIENTSIFYYFPVLLAAGMITGTIIGMLSQKILKAIEKEGKRTFQN